MLNFEIADDKSTHYRKGVAHFIIRRFSKRLLLTRVDEKTLHETSTNLEDIGGYHKQPLKFNDKPYK